MWELPHIRVLEFNSKNAEITKYEYLKICKTRSFVGTLTNSDFSNKTSKLYKR